MQITGIGYRTISVNNFFYANRLGTSVTYISVLLVPSFEVYTEFLKRK